jgi:precorrin-4/cobalt-precorrin-4 C11-methyltransferase
MAKVFFIGAGPGDPELITVKGLKRIQCADLVLYAGSLVPREVVAEAKPTAEVVDSAPLTLEETHALMTETVAGGGIVARVHTGDPALYGAVAEQAALLEAANIDYEIIPGVTSACAAAAAAKVSFTAPETVQSLVITRLPGRTSVPEAQSVRRFAATGAALAVYLSGTMAGELQAELLAGGLAPGTPVVVARQVGQQEEVVVHTDIAGLTEAAAAAGAGRQTLFLVLPGLDAQAARSRLYHPGFGHGRREAR